MGKHELRVVSYELRVTSWKLKNTSWNSKVQVEIQKCEFRSTSYEFEFTSYQFESISYEFKSTSYEFKSTSYLFESTNYQFELLVQKLKRQLNSLKSSSFPNTISPKYLGNLWGNLYVQFLMIISCFTFPLLWKKRPKFFTEKSPSSRLFLGNLLFPLVNVTDFSLISFTQIFVLCL